MFVTFLETEVQSAIDRSLPTPFTNIKCLELINPWEFLLIPWCFIKRHSLKFGINFMSIAYLQLEIETGENLPLHLKGQISKSLPFSRWWVLFYVGCLFLYGCTCNVVAVVKWHGAYFLWVPIIPILWYGRRLLVCCWLGDLIFSHTHFGLDRLEDLQLEVHNWFGFLLIGTLPTFSVYHIAHLQFLML